MEKRVNIGLFFEEKYIKILDKMLRHISNNPNTILKKKDFIDRDIIPPDTSQSEFEYYAFVLDYYCAEKLYRDPSYDDSSDLKSDKRTDGFHSAGGFANYFKHAKQEEEEKNSFEKLKRRLEELQNENFELDELREDISEYKKKFKVSRFFAILFGVISVVLAVWHFFPEIIQSLFKLFPSGVHLFG